MLEPDDSFDQPQEKASARGRGPFAACPDGQDVGEETWRSQLHLLQSQFDAEVVMSWNCEFILAKSLE
jgi:hypothetical protein